MMMRNGHKLRWNLMSGKESSSKKMKSMKVKMTNQTMMEKPQKINQKKLKLMRKMK